MHEIGSQGFRRSIDPLSAHERQAQRGLRDAKDTELRQVTDRD